MTDYPVILGRQADGTFVLRIPALCLVVEDASLDAAWARLEADKAEVIARHRRVGAERDLPAPRSPEGGDLRRFILKVAIAALAASIVMAGAAFSFTYAMREPLHKVGLKLGRTAIAEIGRGLHQAAESEMTPERQAEFRRLVAAAAPRLKPYLAELRPVLAEVCPSP